jgi:hypothetical protein
MKFFYFFNGQVSLVWPYSLHHIGYSPVVWNDALVSSIHWFSFNGGIPSLVIRVSPIASPAGLAGKPGRTVSVQMPCRSKEIQYLCLLLITPVACSGRVGRRAPCTHEGKESYQFQRLA